MNIPERYELGKFGPRGGQASIMHARDKWLNRPVVLKAALTSASYDPQHEMRMLSSISSKHIVAVYDVIRDGDGEIEALVEEHIDGKSIGEYLGAAPKKADILHLVYQIACGLSDVHAKGHVHRDVKPANMKVRNDGLLKIFDFGIGSDLRDGDETEIGKGTHGYKAPELYGKPPLKFSDRSDCYSIAVIAHELLSGGMDAAFEKRPPNPRQAGTSFGTLTGKGRRLTSLLDGCLSISPLQRPSSAALRDALATELVRDKHRAVIIINNTRFVLDRNSKPARIGGTTNYLDVEYTGDGFYVLKVGGNVYVNNTAIPPGYELTGAMVITFGVVALGPNRTFATIDISRPEILV
jgi:eukaryotic-like serine/threonine-protein kinase